MIKRIVKKHQQLILYGLIGATGATLDFLLYLVFYHIFHIPPFIASFLSVSAGIVNNFTLNNKYNFRTKNHIWSRFSTFYLTGVIGAILSSLLIFILFNVLHMDATLAKLLTIIPIVLAQFVINKRISFSDNPKVFYRHLFRFLKDHWMSIAIVSIAAVLFFLSIVYLPATDDMDNMLGGKLLLNGQLPYRDFFSHHTPGMYILSALIYPFTNNDIFNYRFIFNIFTFSLVIVSFLLIKKYINNLTAYSYIILISLAHNIAWMQISIAESLVSVLMTIAIIFIYIKTRAQRLSILEVSIVSLLLFLVPLLSLSYIFPAFVLYLIYFVTTIKRLGSNRLRSSCIIASIYGIPYILSIVVVIMLGLVSTIKYDLLTFNSMYYAPMVGEQGGSVLKTFIAMISNSIQQISLVGRNMLDISYINQTLLLFGIALFALFLWHKQRKVESISIPFLLILLNTRSGIFNPPAIAGSLEHASQHAALYISTALLFGCASSIYFLKNNRQLTKLVSIVWIIIIPFSLLNIWTDHTRSVFTDRKQDNYYTYSKTIRTSNTATVINQFTTKNDYSWIGPADFTSQLYMIPRRASSYTFYMPWLDASPKIRTDLINSFKKDQPKIIYFGEYSNKDNTNYSSEIKTYLKNNFFTVNDSRLKNYYFNKNGETQILKEIKEYGYQNTL